MFGRIREIESLPVRGCAVNGGHGLRARVAFGLLGLEPPKSPAAEAFKKDLKVMDELTRKLRKARMARGALDLDLPEARVIVDPETGAPTDVVRRAQDPGVKRAYSMIEELMLLANEAVALWLGGRRAPTVYRIHGQPDEAKLDYVHFTSPIRRYPDVQVHRAVKAILRGQKPDISTAARDALQLSATLSSARERAVGHRA